MVALISGTAAITLILFLFIAPKFGVRYLFMVRGLTNIGWSVMLGPLSLTKVVGGLVPVMVLPRMIISRSEQLHRMPLFGIALLYMISNTFGLSIVLADGNFFQSAIYFFRILNGFLGFFMIPFFFHDRESFRKLLLAMIIGGIFPVGMMIYSGMTGFSHAVWDEFGEFQRSMGWYHDIVTPKILTFQTIAAILLYWEYFKPNAFKKLFLLILGASCSIAIYYCYSKSATFMFLLWAVTWILLKRKFFLLLLLPLVILVANFAMDNRIFDMVGAIFQQDVGVISGTVEGRYLFQGRLSGWTRTLENFFDASFVNQLFGMGSMAYGAHNDYLRVLVSNGIFGFVIYMLMLVFAGMKIVARVLLNASPLNVMALMLYLMWIVDAIGTVVGMYPETQWLVWGMIVLAFKGVDGLEESKENRRRHESEPPEGVLSTDNGKMPERL